MKKYVIVIFPQNKDNILLEGFRKKVIGQDLVDNLHPHITLKKGFFLNSNFSEDDLLKCFNSFTYKKFEVYFVKNEILGDAYVLIGKSDKLTIAHKKIVKLFGKNIITEKPEWEMGGYKIHLTLFKAVSMETEKIKISKAIFDKMALYEIGDYHHANLLSIINLN